MDILRTKRVSTGRLNEILWTINPKVVKTVLVEGHTNSYPPRFDWAEVTIGSTKYIIELLDVDPRYADDEVDNFLAMLAKHSKDIKFEFNDFKYCKYIAPCEQDDVKVLKEEFSNLLSK